MLSVAIGGLLLAGDAQFPVSIGPASLGLNPVVLALPPGYLGVVWLTRRAEGLGSCRSCSAPRRAVLGYSFGGGAAEPRPVRSSRSYSGIGSMGISPRPRRLWCRL